MAIWYQDWEMRVTDSIKPNKAFLLGVSGGSGSGKTYFARALQRELGESACSIIYQDNFYFDQSKKFDFDGGAVNFDHPDSFDFPLMITCLKKIKRGEATEIPIYDFSTHTRKPETLLVHGTPIVIVDGILIFHIEALRSLFDDLVFFDTPEELRFQRRLDRDVKERGRTPEGVRKQFLQQVKPMHDLYVDPEKIFARTVIDDRGNYEEALMSCQKYLKDLLKSH